MNFNNPREFNPEYRRQKSKENSHCQICNIKGHWTYECSGKRKYLPRESRSKQLKKRLVEDDEGKLHVVQPPVAAGTGESTAKETSDSSSSSDSESDSSTSSSSSSSSSNNSEEESSSKSKSKKKKKKRDKPASKK